MGGSELMKVLSSDQRPFNEDYIIVRENNQLNINQNTVLHPKFSEKAGRDLFLRAKMMELISIRAEKCGNNVSSKIGKFLT